MPANRMIHLIYLSIIAHLVVGIFYYIFVVVDETQMSQTYKMWDFIMVLFGWELSLVVALGIWMWVKHTKLYKEQHEK